MMTNSEKICRNCNSPMPADAKFCPSCSQKYTTGKIPFHQFIGDFIQHYFNVDSRFFRTLTALFIPGKLTNEYFLGKHKSYANPLQLFLVPAFVLFALVSWNLSTANLGDDADIQLKQDLDWIDFYKKLDTVRVQTDSLFTSPIASIAMDSLITKMKRQKTGLKDSLDLNDFGTFGKSFKLPPVAKRDLLAMSPNELVELYGKDRSFTEKLVMRQAAKFKKGGRGIIDFFISKQSIMLLLMMPVLALILKLLYIRREYYYVEHLVFTLHFHAFVFILILLLGLLGSYLPGIVIGFSILSIFVYLFLAMKNFYRQSKRKTFVKFMVLLFSYILISLLFSVLALVFSFLLF